MIALREHSSGFLPIFRQQYFYKIKKQKRLSPDWMARTRMSSPADSPRRKREYSLPPHSYHSLGILWVYGAGFVSSIF